MQNPLDLFYVHNPTELFQNFHEEILITLDNKYIIKNHLCCASKEIPITLDIIKEFNLKNEEFFDNCIQELISESLLMKRGDKYYWRGDFFPNEVYGLNDLSTKSYKVILKKGSREELLTTEDESYVFRDLHPGAVYLYEADTYIVNNLDIIERKVFISQKDVDFYTQSLKHTEITPLEILLKRTIGLKDKISTGFGNVKVEHEYYSYKVINTITQEIISRHPLEDIPIIEFETQAVWFEIPFEDQKELELAGFDLGGTIHAIEHAMIAMAPALAQISRWDLGGVSIDFDPVKQQPIVYIYDAYKGGIGISEQLYQNLLTLMKLAYDLINSCNCKTDNGCPGCIMSPKCGNQNEPLDKNGALFLLSLLLDIPRKQ
jgi:DEAD/DEAH box helicase domain-containing protein